MQCTEERFKKDTENHVITVLHDDNGYMHVSFKKPGSSAYAVWLMIWPGYLTIVGDMGSAVYSRITDMVEFFHAKDINVHYWTEKLQSAQPKKDFVYEKAEEWVNRVVNEYIKEYSEHSYDEEDNEILVEPDWSDDLQSEISNLLTQIKEYDSTDHAGHLIYNFSYEHNINSRKTQTFNLSVDGDMPDMEEYTFRHTWQLRAINHICNHLMEQRNAKTDEERTQGE